MPTLFSDPLSNSMPNVPGEWNLFQQPLSDVTSDWSYIPWARLGRLRHSPVFFSLVPTWTSNPPLLPVDDLLPMFQDVYLQRRYLQQLIPESIFGNWAVKTLPKVDYTLAHFRSRMFGQQQVGDPSTGIWNTRWYLYYGAFSGLDPIQFLDQPTFDQTTEIAGQSLAPVDSQAVANGSEFDDPPTTQGWNLYLVHKFFVNTDGSPTTDPIQGIPFPGTESPPAVVYHAYGVWTLHQEDADNGYRVWDPTQSSRWDMVTNLLNFPPNYITLKPFQP